MKRFIEYIQSGELGRFYNSRAWRRLRKEVLADFKFECQDCKKEGYYTRATIVHHEKQVRDYPHLCLSKYYIEDGKQKNNLTPLCDRHHDLRHPERLKSERRESEIIERWD